MEDEPDTPQKFIKSVMDTDNQFIQGVDSSTLLGVYLVPNPLHVLDPLFNPILNQLKAKMNSVFEETKKIVDNPPKCIQSDDIYVTKNYVTKSEIPFVMDAIKRTAMSKYTHVPEGTEELRQRISNIKCCHGED